MLNKNLVIEITGHDHKTGFIKMIHYKLKQFWAIKMMLGHNCHTQVSSLVCVVNRKYSLQFDLEK